MLDITITDSRQTAILEERETFISEKKSKRRLWESGILLS